MTPVSPFPTLGTTARRSGDVLPTLGRCLGPLILIVLATTWPLSRFQSHAHWASVEWIPFSKFVRPIDVVANVLLFVPFGVAFSWGGTTDRRYRRAVAWALACSVAVELGQVYTHNRVPSVTDLMANSAGAWLGAYWAVRRHRQRLAIESDRRIGDWI
ncbi:MAG TPA: VanZ family protein [Vicinamibacterales bacterium]|nr:VanZ family protein [Vicinamibacterales bacterium]